MGASTAPKTTEKLLGEFVGTFLLVFTVGCNVLTGNAVWGGISIASVLTVCIYALGGISGANFNPAVSLSLALLKIAGGEGMDIKTAAKYICVQLVAGIVAALCYTALFWNTFDLAPAPSFGFLHAGLCEVLYTFFLCFVVLNVCAAKARPKNDFYGLAIGFVVVAGAYGAGAISGGCFNPAVAIGIDLASAHLGFGWCIVYTLCELVGAALAVGAFMVVRPEEFDKPRGLSAELVSEFLGTFMLVLTVGLNVLGKSLTGAYSIAASLMCMVYALGDVSGAHFNPAVTLAIFASGRAGDKLAAPKASAYVAAQLAGAAVAAATYSRIHKGASFALGPGYSFGWSQALIAESIFTFVLCFVVLAVAVANVTNSKEMFGLAIGACVTAGGCAIGKISGGSLNPAVSLGVVLAHLPAGGSFVPFLAYSLFELAGAGAAVGVFKVTHAVDDAGTLEK